MSEPPLPPPPMVLTVDDGWRRLDGRMLLVHPVTELVRFLPALVGLFVLGQGIDGGPWRALGVLVPISVGLLRWYTTRYRITDSQVELTRGLLSRKVLRARLDRVRAVELTSSPIHRVLGLAKVRIGTGSTKGHDDEFDLDSLDLEEARALRAALLHRAATTSDTDPAAASRPLLGSTSLPLAGPDAARSTEPDDEVLLRGDLRWARYAPLTSSGVVVAVAGLGFLSRGTERITAFLRHDQGLTSQVESTPLALLVVAGVLLFVVIASLVAVVGYVVTNGGFVLSRDPRGRSLRVRRGLLTNKETSLETQRIRGLELSEPLGLRLVGAARLAVIVTGVTRKESGSTPVVPPAPRATVLSTWAALVPGAAYDVPLVGHGPAATRRRYTRATVPTLVVVLAWGSLWVAGLVPAWAALLPLLLLPLALLLAHDRARRLGHALAGGYLVVRQGSLRGCQDALAREGIIGWRIRQSFFQRRAGLATLVATTAAGRQAYAVPDLPEHEAHAIAHAALPGLLDPFLV